MLGIFAYIFDIQKEILIGFSLSILYITYYLVEVVKKPELVCQEGKFRGFLEKNVPILNEYYWPTPWCIESRLQTIIGSLLRSHFLEPVEYERQVVQLSDGGQLALDWVAGGGTRALVVVLPGLTGGAHADYVRCIVAGARAAGAACVVFNNRGLGGLPLASPRLYCALSHADLAEALAAVRRRRPGALLLAAGVSLGGLILGHHLAAAGADTPLHAAIVISSPLDVIKGTASLEAGGLNACVSWHMARALRREVRRHAALGAARWDRRGVAAARSLRQFDAAFTAAHFGFGSVDAYYAAANLRGRLGAVRVPLLCLCAADDPCQPRAALPLREAGAAPRVALAVTSRGGHLGFLEGWWPARGATHQYMARVVAQYFSAVLDAPDALDLPDACDGHLSDVPDALVSDAL